MKWNISLPSSWEQLNDAQLIFLFRSLVRIQPVEQVMTLCFMKWAGIKIIGRESDGTVLCTRHHDTAYLPVAQIEWAMSQLSWLKTFSSTPVRISRIGKATALPADFQEVPFRKFIYADNLYQGYLHTTDTRLLQDLTQLLYDSDTEHFRHEHLINSFYWFASLKAYFARMFPHFLQPATPKAENLLGAATDIATELRDSMNAQIRALTGGDITREKAVLDMDTWRALTELDAKARDAEEMEKLYKK